MVIYGCNKDLTVDNSPLGDFNLLFEYLEKDYSYKNEHSFTMQELKNRYLPQIKTDPTYENLADIFLKITLNELKDPHVFFHNTTPSPYEISKVTEKNPKELDEIIPEFHEIDITATTDIYTYGVLKSDRKIGYIYIHGFNTSVGGTSSLGVDTEVTEINNIIKILKLKAIKSMIVDIRSNAGGSNYVPRYIARQFVNKTGIYMIEEYPEEGGFKTKTWKVSPSIEDGFREGKVVLLSNGVTCSGGEMFVLAMLQRDNLIHIGSRSKGCSGNVADKDFSNGWNMRITSSKTTFPDGKSYFKKGIEPGPDYIVKNDDSYDTNFKDKLIERAIKELQ